MDVPVVLHEMGPEQGVSNMSRKVAKGVTARKSRVCKINNTPW